MFFIGKFHYSTGDAMVNEIFFQLLTGCSSSLLNFDTDLLFFMKRFENISIWSFHCLKILFVGSIENFSRTYFGGGGGSLAWLEFYHY